MKTAWLLSSLLLGVVSAAGCTAPIGGGGGGGTGGSGGGTSCTPPAFATADAGVAQAVIVTNAALAPGFQRLAALHSVTGITTEVVTVESICAASTCTDADPLHDTAKAIKEALKARAGLRYVVLGGGVEIVPARWVHDDYANPLVPTYTFSSDFVTDYYYSDFSEWDTNANGVYAEKGIDTPGYLPNVAVSRIPVHTPSEVDAYTAKVVHHLTAYDGTRVAKALLMSNIATQYNGLNIDAAYYFEAAGRTRSLLPTSFAIEKLYANVVPKVDASAGTYSAGAEEAALLEGQNLVVHSGHAGTTALTVEYDGTEVFSAARAIGLTNQTLPIFLSCGCQAGDYSAAHNAGEQLLQAPAGGAIAYLGNAPLGLGLAGGMQMIDELLRYVQANDAPLLADAYLAAHRNLPTADTFSIFGLMAPVVDQNSYQWTQKGVVLMGDELIPVWKSARTPAPTVTVTSAAVCEGTTLTFTLPAPATGTLRVLAGGALYELPLNAQSTAALTINQSPASVAVGFASPGSWYGYQSLTL